MEQEKAPDEKKTGGIMAGADAVINETLSDRASTGIADVAANDGITDSESDEVTNVPTSSSSPNELGSDGADSQEGKLKKEERGDESQIATTQKIDNMTEEEAQKAAEQLKAFDVASSEIGKIALDFHDREGWRKLTYSSFKKWAEAEIPFSVKHVYRLIGVARARRDIADIANPEIRAVLKDLADSSIEALSKLDHVEQQIQAIEMANRYCRGGKITAKKIELAVKFFLDAKKPDHDEEADSVNEEDDGPKENEHTIDLTSYNAVCVAESIRAVGEAFTKQVMAALKK